MNFMPDACVPCDECGGRRYGPDLLEIRWKGKNISEVLEMTFEEAAKIAKDSECGENGELTGEHTYNENTKTWWMEIVPFDEKKGCNPACVVSEEANTARINWRCTGLLA